MTHSLPEWEGKNIPRLACFQMLGTPVKKSDEYEIAAKDHV